MRALQLRRALWLFFIFSVIVFFASKLAAAPSSNEARHEAALHTEDAADDDDGDNRSKARPDIHEEWFGNSILQILYFDDSDSILAVTRGGPVRRSDDGGSNWEDVKGLPEGKVLEVILHPYGKPVAIALGIRKTHWITKNRGKTWTAFTIDGFPALMDEPPIPIISWHAADENKIIMNTRVDGEGGRIAQAIYTNDAFDSPPKTLRQDVRQCLWAREQEHFTSKDSTIDEDRVLCVAFGKYSPLLKDQRLLMSNDYFRNDEREPKLEDNRPVSGIVRLVTAKAFILTARKTEGTKEMALYVTTNTKKWHRAQFGEHQLIEDGYTIMESTNYSLQVDVSASVSRFVHLGTLYSSNSLGRSFTPNEVYTNRNEGGWVDFEKIAGIQGIALVNKVANAEQVIRTGAFKKIKSQITFDDGRIFNDLKTANGENLHLHSVTERNNIGRTFSNLAPGIVMGNGNIGSELDSRASSDLYVSDDAGLTFRNALTGSHMYEIGDQGSVILAVEDDMTTSTLSYSLDHGKTWDNVSLADYNLKATSVKALSLSNLPDSTGLKFLLSADAKVGPEFDHYIYTIDFNGLGKRKCGPKDMEEWYARIDKSNKPTCIMGHTQKFRRRKADADCVIGTKFKDPVAVEENCECTRFDFECDAGFALSKDRKSCTRLPDNPPSSNKCKGDQKTFKDTSGFRKIPGNTCKDGFKPDKEVERPCSSGGDKAPAANGEVTSKLVPFEADRILELVYLERGDSSTGDDETILLLTNEYEVFVSHDHGKHYEQVKTGDPIRAIYPHRYFGDQVYLVTQSTRVYYSKTRAYKWDQFQAPDPPNNRVPVLRFHPGQQDWLIWTSCADTRSESNCKAQAWVSLKNGAEWHPMLKAVENCEFVWREEPDRNKRLTYCVQHHNEDNSAALKLLSSEDWFDETQELFSDMIEFATMSEFIVVAAKTGKNNQYLKVDASIDGKTFADAKFPSNMVVNYSSAYALLESSTNAIFLHVTINAAPDHEYGTIVKSNSNGTSYTMSLQNVNRDPRGYVDFEKLQALRGTAVANIVDNVDQVLKGKTKKLKTVITHDDGATWNLVKPPTRDTNGKKFQCTGKKLEECSLHLHGFTERDDPRDTYSSPAAVGLMLGVGNVGDILKPKRDCDTFISKDGGMSWKMAMEGQYMWEFGDRGGIIVIVDADRPTKEIYFSTDEGENWKRYQFHDRELDISDITTVPSDTSRNFLLQGREMGNQAVTINLDFTGLTSRECNVTNPGTKESDYELWEPKHPGDKDNKEENCLFGHVSQYLRKKPERECYNPPKNFPNSLVKIKKNCSCTRQDFECDYNFEPQKDGSCKLVSGKKPPDGSKICKQKNRVKWYEPTGYRRVPLSTCEGGKELEYIESKSHACPGKEDDFEKQRGGIGGVGLFFAIVIPIGAAAAIGWWMWRNLEGRFGRIRLGDSGGGELRALQVNGHRKDWTKYPVMVVSGVVAVVMAVPMLVGILWRSVRERMPGGRRSFYSTYGRSGYGENGNGGPYTSRDSFARGGRDYSDGPHNDERDLLGDDSDDD